MDNILRGGFGKNKKSQPQQAPFEVRFGESQGIINCSNCQRPEKVGFFVIYGPGAVLVCIHCTAKAIAKYQETHLFAKAVEIDAEVPPEVVDKVSQAVVKENGDLPESKVDKIVRSAISKL